MEARTSKGLKPALASFHAGLSVLFSLWFTDSLCGENDSCVIPLEARTCGHRRTSALPRPPGQRGFLTDHIPLLPGPGLPFLCPLQPCEGFCFPPISWTFCRPLSCTPESFLLIIQRRWSPSVGSRLWLPRSVCQQEGPPCPSWEYALCPFPTPCSKKLHSNEASASPSGCSWKTPFPDTSPSGWPTPTHPALPQTIALVLINACDERRRVVFRLGSELLIYTDSARSSPSPRLTEINELDSQA